MTTEESAKRLPSDLRSLRGKEKWQVLLDYLPLDGRKIRTEALFARAEKRGISRATVAKYLRIWEKKGLVQRSVAIVDDRPAVFYRLALDYLWPGPRKGLYQVLGDEDEWAELFRRREKGYRTREDLERFLRIQDAVLWIALGDLLTQAAETGSRDGARERAEIAVDYMLRRWIVSLAEVMWLRRKDSTRALLRARSRAWKGYEKVLDKLVEESERSWTAAARRAGLAGPRGTSEQAAVGSKKVRRRS